MFLKNNLSIKYLQCLKLNIALLNNRNNNSLICKRCNSVSTNYYTEDIKEIKWARLYNIEKNQKRGVCTLKKNQAKKKPRKVGFAQQITIQKRFKYTTFDIENNTSSKDINYENKNNECVDEDSSESYCVNNREDNYQGEDKNNNENFNSPNEENNCAYYEENTQNEAFEELDDDIDSLLFTNNLNSSFIGNLWHTSANSVYTDVGKNIFSSISTTKKYKKDTCLHDDKFCKSSTSNDFNSNENELDHMKRKGNKIKNGENTSLKIERKENELEYETNCKDGIYAENLVDTIERNKLKKNAILSNSIVKKIYEEEMKEANKMKEYFEKNEENLIKYRNSILCKLNISKELSKKFKHLSKETNIFNNEKSKEEYYKKIIDSLNYEKLQEPFYKRRNSNNNNNNNRKAKNYDKIETIKILNIDSLPCNVLNNLFAYKIVKNCSAELCLKIITRLGMYRDKYSQVSYENMINYLSQVITSSHNAEIISLFSRCYETISIPFLVNYVRTYGTFSRSFIVNMYDKYFRKRLFDFVRYENNMGIRKIPSILTHPYHLSSYIKLLGECSAKKDMYIQLKMRGHIPYSQDFNGEKKTDELNYLMDLEDHSKTKKININYNHNSNKLSMNNNVKRPKIYDAILSAEYTGLPLEHFIEKEQKKLTRSHLKATQLEEQCSNLIQEIKIVELNKEGIEEEYDEDNCTNRKESQENNIETNSIICKETHVESCNYEMETSGNFENSEKTTDKKSNEHFNFILDDNCDIYVYKGFNKLNKSSFKLQTTLVKSEKEQESNLTLYSNKDENFEEIDKEQNNEALWELPWKTRKKNSFFFKGRFFKILPDKGWTDVKHISEKYIRPRRKRKKHFIRRKRVLQKKMKINLFKKKILEK
ncbi:conserved Plasmodium protein, unknown function [Plasmodium berghei]|uniref:Uncharacterized protein n=1 Tax=Plasmodium berghei TaxID=5821 RepID=A0A0Z0AS36_PLABE|nr:conserved Plasmodium protein, unknown function [Plasmodium berghei]SCO62648.1 conserved Plasmodium protein, unknown function [Plasmodium berghei]